VNGAVEEEKDVRDKIPSMRRNLKKVVA